MSKPLRVVFMGTPEFAVQSLDAIVQSNHKVVGVVTSADKPAGRGKKLKGSAVKDYAISCHLKLLQPEKLKNEVFLSELRELNADIFVVVAFRMLPELVWNMPPLGTFNLHASLLPQYRGAAPINYAIINGEKESGVTTFFLDKKIDTGRIILQNKTLITEESSAGDLHDQLMVTGSQLVVDTLDKVSSGYYQTIDQMQVSLPEGDLNSAPKIYREDCRIDFNRNTSKNYNLIRGLSPFPGAFTEIISPTGQKYTLKIFQTEMIDGEQYQPGTIRTDEKKFLHIACKDGLLNILELQLQGKKRMKVQDLLRGFQINNKWSLSE